MERTVLSESVVQVGLDWTKLASLAGRTARKTTFRIQNLTGDLIALRVVEGASDKELEEFYGSESVCGAGGVQDMEVTWGADYVELQAMANTPGPVKVEELAPDYAMNPTLVSPIRTDVGER